MSQSGDEELDVKIASITTGDQSLVVRWDDDGENEYHYVWLRENCGCEACRHPEAWERLLDPLSYPLDITPDEVEAAERVYISWPGGHRSAFSTGWLRANAYGPAARRNRDAQPTLWTAASIASRLPEIHHERVVGSGDGVLQWLRMVREFGFAIVRGVPAEPGRVALLAQRIAFIQETNFGRVFDVVSKPDPENLAYTAVRLGAHTDVPNRRGLPGLQFLHCIEFDAEGGESILIDGYEAARRLLDEWPESHDILTSVHVPYRFQDDTTDIVNKVPVIGTDLDGNHTEIRFHTALLDTIDLDPDLVVPFYRAFRRFAEILRDPDLELRFKMVPGDCQVFDNRRVLHARAEFDPNSGGRHLQGTYVDRDDFLSRLRVLERDGADFRTR